MTARSAWEPIAPIPTAANRNAAESVSATRAFIAHVPDGHPSGRRGARRKALSGFV
jgi:hypothetical protein